MSTRAGYATALVCLVFLLGMLTDRCSGQRVPNDYRCSFFHETGSADCWQVAPPR